MNYYFYTVDFEDRYGRHYFRLMTANKTLDHVGRLAAFQKELGSQYTITAYGLDDSDMDDDWMRENDISTMRFRDTYWDRAIQGAA